MSDLKNYRAIVTGGLSGIGKAIVESYVRSGAKVVVLDRDAANAEFKAALPSVSVIQCDVADPVSTRQAFDAACNEMGGLDVAVANAGISQNSPTLDLDYEGWRKVMSVNLDGVFLTAHEAGRRMKDTGGSIIMTSSMYGVVAAPERVGHCTSKAGVVMMMKVLAIEWAKLGIRVNAIAPGYVKTALVEDLAARGRLDIDKLTNRIPMGRLITTDEIADAACFLASDQARAITGQVLGVDGGWTAYGYL